MSTWIMALDTSRRPSQSRTSRRIIQPKVRSTTHRRGRTRKPRWPAGLRTLSRTKPRRAALLVSRARQPAAIIRPVGEQVLEPRPALADRRDDLLGTRRVLHVGGSHDHQAPPIGVHGDTAPAPLHPLRGVAAAPAGSVRRLHALAVKPTGGRARPVTNLLTVEHGRDVVDRPEQQPAHEASEPPAHRPPRPEANWRHAPATAPSGQGSGSRLEPRAGRLRARGPAGRAWAGAA